MKHHINISIKRQFNENIRILFRDKDGELTDIHEYESDRPAAQQIVDAILGQDFRIRKVR